MHFDRGVDSCTSGATIHVENLQRPRSFYSSPWINYLTVKFHTNKILLAWESNIYIYVYCIDIMCIVREHNSVFLQCNCSVHFAASRHFCSRELLASWNMEDWTLDRTTFEIIGSFGSLQYMKIAGFFVRYLFNFLFLNNMICKICKSLEEYLINVLKNFSL